MKIGIGIPVSVGIAEETPFLEIYSLKIFKEKLKELLEKVEKCEQEREAFLLNPKDIIYEEGKKTVIVRFELNEKLYEMHAAVVTYLRNLKEGPLEEKYRKDNNFYKTLSPKQQKNIEYYGSPNVMEKNLYKPTLRFGINKDFKEKKVKKKLKDISVEKVTVYEKTDSQEKKIIKEFSFKPREQQKR